MKAPRERLSNPGSWADGIYVSRRFCRMLGKEESEKLEWAKSNGKDK